MTMPPSTDRKLLFHSTPDLNLYIRNLHRVSDKLIHNFEFIKAKQLLENGSGRLDANRSSTLDPTASIDSINQKIFNLNNLLKTNLMGVPNGSMAQWDPQKGVQTLRALASSLDPPELAPYIDMGLHSLYDKVRIESIFKLNRLPASYRTETRWSTIAWWVNDLSCSLENSKNSLALTLIPLLPDEYQLGPLSHLVRSSQYGAIANEARSMLKELKIRLFRIKSAQPQNEDQSQLLCTEMEKILSKLSDPTFSSYHDLVYARWTLLNRLDVKSLIAIGLQSDDLRLAIPACQLYLEVPPQWKDERMMSEVIRKLESGVKCADYSISLPAAALAFLIPSHLLADSHLRSKAFKRLEGGMWSSSGIYLKTLHFISGLPKDDGYANVLRQYALDHLQDVDHFSPDSWQQVLHERSVLAYQLGIIKELPIYHTSSDEIPFGA